MASEEPKYKTGQWKNVSLLGQYFFRHKNQHMFKLLDGGISASVTKTHGLLLICKSIF